MIYFDHNATTPMDSRVLEAMQPYLTNFYGNPSSLYRLGRIARTAIEVAREQVAALVGVQPVQIVFTSGGTEANNLALAVVKPYAKLAVSAIEHPSVMAPAQALQQKGHELSIIPVDQQGLIDSIAIDRVIAEQVKFVSIMLANNETGVMQNIAELAQRLRAHQVVVHTDAVQALGKTSVSFAQLGVQLMTLSSHKIYGPKGCGALVFDRDVALQAVILGGGQEHDYRSGTENVAAIVGFGQAADLARMELEQRRQNVLRLKHLLESALAEMPKVRLFSDQVERLPNTLQFGIDGVDGEMLLMQLDQRGIAVSSGSACASGASEPSPVLVAMGFDKSIAKTAIRVSFGKDNSEAEVIELVELLKNTAL